MRRIWHFTSFFLKFKSSLLEKRFFFLSNSALTVVILDLILHVQLATFVVMHIIEISHVLHLFLIYHELY